MSRSTWMSQSALLAAALAVFALAAAPAGAAPGDLDPSFSNDGRVSTLTSPDTFVARAVAVQPDGRIVVAGYSCDTGTCGPTGDSSFRLVRYTADGGLDTDFGMGGMVTTPIGAGRSQAYDVLVRPDGKIVVGGVASMDLADPGSFALARYLPDGRLDTGFGSGRARADARGRGLRRDLRPAGRLGRPRRRARAGPGRRARPLRARALHRARRARPQLRLRRLGDRADLRALRLRRGRRDAARRADRRGRRVGPVLGRREPPLQRRGGRLQRRHRRAVAAPGRRDLLVRATPPSRCPDGRGVLSAGVATERSGHPGMALVRTSAEGAPDPGWDGDGTALVRARDGSVATDVVLEPNGRAVAAGHSSLGAQARLHARPLRRLRRARPQLRRPGRGADRLPRHGDRARDRAGAPGRRQARRRGHRLRRRQRPAVRRRDRAARAGPLPWAATPRRPARRPASGAWRTRRHPPRRAVRARCPPA